jgi:hypothetical protein
MSVFKALRGFTFIQKYTAPYKCPISYTPLFKQLDAAEYLLPTEPTLQSNTTFMTSKVIIPQQACLAT